MITREEAHKIAFDYLKNGNTSFKVFATMEEVKFEEEGFITFGKRKWEHADLWIVPYTIELANEEEDVFIEILAETGEILYSRRARGYIPGPNQ